MSTGGFFGAAATPPTSAAASRIPGRHPVIAIAYTRPLVWQTRGHRDRALSAILAAVTDRLRPTGGSVLKRFLIVLPLIAMLGATLGAQQAPPEIPFDSVPNFLKLPPDMNFGEVARRRGQLEGPRLRVHARRTAPAVRRTARRRRSCSSSVPDGKFIREIGKDLYAWSFAHTVRIDKDDNIWAIDKGSDMIIKFNPEGRVVMVFGRKKEASDEAAAVDARQPAAPAGRRPVPPADRRHVGHAGQHLHQRRLHQLARREVRQERRLGEVVGRAGHRARAVQHAALHRHRRAAATSTSPIAATAASRCSIPTASSCARSRSTCRCRRTRGRRSATAADRERARHAWRRARRGRSASRPGRTRYLYASDAYPGRIYKLSLDGKVLGVLGKAGKQPKQFGWIHEIACPSENELYVAEMLNWRVQKLTLHPAKSGSAPKP